jgi:hypothetical protein
MNAKEIKVHIHEGRGDSCIYCAEPTSIVAMKAANRGVMCQCDWIYKEFEKILNDAQ